jgi:class 3 adenylate cyclase
VSYGVGVTLPSPEGAYAPGGFDTARESTTGLPPALVERWRQTGQTADDARRLLSAHTVRGFTLVSDSAGLTELGERLGPLQVLALIDRPKRILYAHTRAIGGRAVGVWAADNTQMFHPDDTDAGLLLSALLSAQEEIGRRCRVRIGIGVHHGDFYALPGGLYGAQADALEDLAENHTAGGEIVVTDAVVDRLHHGHRFVLRRREDGDPVYPVLDGPRLDGPPPVDDAPYPIPYSPAFYADLLRLERAPHDAGLAGRLMAAHLRTRAVVLVERGAVPAETPELTLVRGLALSTVMRETGLRLLPSEGALEIKVAGRLGIYVFDEPEAAVAFAQRLRTALAEREITCRIGVDTGPVLVGDLPGGGRDIAGAPVNVASKMAQDLGTPGHIHLGETLRDQAVRRGFAPRRHTVSGVPLTYYEG